MLMNKIVHVIDDDPLFSELVAQMLLKSSFQPVLSPSIEDALGVLDGDHVACLLVDIFMPGMGGIEGIRVIKEEIPDVKIIAISGGWHKQKPGEALAAARKVGADWALAKPFSLDDLKEAFALIGCLGGAPVAKPRTQTPDAANPNAAISALVVDDDALITELLASGLCKHKVKDITLAGNGIEALETLRKRAGEINLIITDLEMPGMDGMTFMRHLCEQDFNGCLCVMSGLGTGLQNSATILAQEHGFKVLDPVKKPVTLENLGLLLGQWHKTMDKPIYDNSTPYTEEEFRAILSAGRLEVHYQPKVDLHGMEITGAEALMRWRHPDLGLLFPGEFITAAEKYGAIMPLTNKIMMTVVKDMVKWHQQGLDLKVSVNLSLSELNDFKWPDFVAQYVASKHIPADRLVLEVTESAVDPNLGRTLEILGRLRLKGFHLSMDDFGSGFSSLSRLQQIPFSELKLDRSFVNNVDNDRNKLAILKSSIAMGRQLGLSLVAEGVELEGEMATLRELRVDTIQGYYFAKPMNNKDFSAWITEFRSAAA